MRGGQGGRNFGVREFRGFTNYSLIQQETNGVEKFILNNFLKKESKSKGSKRLEAKIWRVQESR